jgi:hypothetical protein
VALIAWPRWTRFLVALSVLAALSLLVPDGADAKHKRPKRRNSLAIFENGFDVPPVGSFTCMWYETPVHDYGCNPGLSVGTPEFGFVPATPEFEGRPPHALRPGRNYPHEVDVDGWGGRFPLASPDIAPRFSCRWAGAGPPVDEAAEWRCAFTYNAHTHRFRVNQMVSVGYEQGEQGTRQYFAPCDRTGPCPELDRPPNTRITSGPRRVVASKRATLRFRSSEPGSTFQCSLGSADWAPCRAPARLRAVPEGRQVFRVRAVDDRGKIDATPSRRRWRVDTTGPVIAILGGPVRLTRSGVAEVRLRCRRTERSGPCAGRLRLATRGGLRLGSGRFRLAPGGRGRAGVELTPRGRAFVFERGEVQVRASIRARDRLGNVARSTGTLTLRAP